MADNHKPLPGAHLVGNHHLTGLVFGNNTWHTSGNGLGGASKNYDHLTNDNKVTKGRHTLLWWRETGIITQRGGHPLHTVRVCHGTLSGQSVTVNNHDHGTMGKQRLPAVYPHPGQWPKQEHQYSHEKQVSFIHNTINISRLQHTWKKRHRPTKADPKHTRMITHNFLPLATALKWPPRKEIPCHWSYPLISNMGIWFHPFYPWNQFTIILDYPRWRRNILVHKFS